MKTRIVLFTRLASAEDSAAVGKILFGRWGANLTCELPENMGVEEFARKLALKRHSTFDYAVGDMGRTAALLECTDPATARLQIGDTFSLKLTWQPFRETALALTDGGDRRILQLAVQFIASGAQLDDSVIAADYDAEFLQQLQGKLAEQEMVGRKADDSE
ncbi:MAG: hypothetical protein RLZZ488_1466 [Pseudomonadota bacterium]|jgi:hypothetical protein